MSIYQGWTPTEYVKPANRAQLVALRDLLLGYNDQHAAAAVDNVIDILSQPKPAQHLTLNLELEEIERDWNQQKDELRGGL